LPIPTGIRPQWAWLFSNRNVTQTYLELFPEAKLEWAMNGWIDWLDL
jgi:hypothetical protein